MFVKFQNQPRQFNRGRRNQPKPLDSALFVRKSSPETVAPQHIIKNKFTDFLIADQLKNNILEKGYSIPTPIQDQVIPVILQGRDVIGIANTGTGKTAAFLIPLINKVFYNRSQKVLIITPTRELAVQIQEECILFSRGMNIFSVLTIGGVNLHGQSSALKRNPQFIIGTPGRLKDLAQQGKLDLSQCNNTVLDEVDKMMDMGFINDIRFLISKLPSQRQSLFFSATIPSQVIPIMHNFLNNPETISVKTQSTAQKVEQDIVKLGGRNKIDVLTGLLSNNEFSKVIVFGRTKWGIEKLSNILLQKGLRISAIHGNKNQNQRQRALEQFKKGEIQVLLATDVASRGLDIEGVTHVINYDQPASYDDYVHRIGRTGRADKKGVALTFVD